MKLASSTIIAALVLCCTAAFGQTTVKLGFLSHDQKTQYCDYEQITIEKGYLVTGTHFIAPPGSQTCFTLEDGGLNGTMAGLATTFSASSGLTVTGTVATFADNTYDEQGAYMGACGCAEYYVSILRPSTSSEMQAGKYGWALYTNFGGTATLQNFGFTTQQLGNDNANGERTFDLQFN